MTIPGGLSLLGVRTGMPCCCAVPPALGSQTSSPFRILLRSLFMPFPGRIAVLSGEEQEKMGLQHLVPEIIFAVKIIKFTF